MGVWKAFDNRRGKTMKYLAILCLSLGLAGCFQSGPFGSIGGNGRVADLGACAHSPIQPAHEDKLCSRQDANPN